MAKKVVCRSCALQYKELYRHTQHKLVDVGFHCPVCDNSGKCYSHTDKALWGEALECKRCHNYILYLSPKGEFDKDEIYLPNDICVCRYLHIGETTIFVADKTVVDLKQILQFTTKKKLVEKVRTILTFS